ncbi:MAG TPA: sulfotransferase [Candidatus Baltobacteraceae bacterium]|nr:sulfotransferase [Candidatus Baltobacteraceae bacterium]
MRPQLDTSSLLQAIAAARERFAVAAPAHLELNRRYDATYWLDQSPEWLPRVAEIDATLSGPAPWYELEIFLASGPTELYRYFPFAAYIYIDGIAQAVLEFDGPDEVRRAVVNVPMGKRFTITAVSELSAPPTEADERELAVILHDISVGKELRQQPQRTAWTEVDANAQRTTPLLEKLPRPIFVVGSYRSGTSVLTWALGQHPNIWALDETRWLQLLGSGALAAYAVATDAPVHYFGVYDVTRSEYMAYLGSAIDRFVTTTSKRRAEEVALKRLSGLDPRYHPHFQLRRSALAPKQRWIDGTPENADCILLLHELFPAARFVCVLRDPRDVIASMLHFHRAGGLAMDVETAGSMWLQKLNNCLLAYQALGPQFVRVVPYETYAEPAATLRDLFAFLDEPDFPRAIDTFGERINTSSLTADERRAAYDEIDRTPDSASAVSELYERFKAAVSTPWEYDDAAHVKLRDIQNEIVHRMVEAVV